MADKLTLFPDMALPDPTTCPICGSDTFKIYRHRQQGHVHLGYCRDCQKRTGYGGLHRRVDGTWVLRQRRQPSKLCAICGEPTRNRTGRCGPICSEKGQRVYRIWWEKCPYGPCENMMLKSDNAHQSRRRYCSGRCSKKAGQQSNEKLHGRRRTVKRNKALQIAYLHGYKCAICKRLIDVSLPPGHDRSMEIDHIMEWSQGGTNDISNLRPLHRRCHREREYLDTVQLMVT